MEKMKRKKRIGIGRYLGRRVNFSSIKEIIIHSRMIGKMRTEIGMNYRTEKMDYMDGLWNGFRKAAVLILNN